MKTRVLVTGANGQLGQTLKELYSSDSTIDFTFTTKTILDITNKYQVDTFLSQNSFDFCINCAAFTNVEQAEKTPDPAFLVNAEAVKNIAEACKKNNIILIHISTDYVFDGKKQIPYQENDYPKPINQYGKSKLLGENYIKQISSKYFIIRTSWLYSKYGHNFLTSIIKKIHNKEQLSITTSQKGTPTSCIDLSEFIIQLIKDKITSFGLYHFSALGETTRYEYALEICKQFIDYNCKNITPVKTFHAKAKRPEYSVLDNSKARLLFKNHVLWNKKVEATIKDIFKGKTN
jgi:dTDP-4-dehydrorhamnose reductase